jgi:hypothetical protein
LIRSKDGLPELENFEIKYGFEGFEDKNNFIHKNIFILKVDFE